VQEMMVDGSKARAIMSSLFPSWKCCAVASMGLYGGLYATWNPLRVDFSPYVIHVGILLEGVIREGNRPVKILNCYGPYDERKYFWEHVAKSGILDERKLIIVGDLNFTISSREVWGKHARLDPLARFFHGLFMNHGFVDIESISLSPTWNNGRCGEEGVVKRLD
jgi:hypothetical protein